jgi:hypothetical protein
MPFRVGPEYETGYDAEIAAASPQRPEGIGIGHLIGGEECAV